MISNSVWAGIWDTNNRIEIDSGHGGCYLGRGDLSGIYTPEQFTVWGHQVSCHASTWHLASGHYTNDKIVFLMTITNTHLSRHRDEGMLLNENYQMKVAIGDGIGPGKTQWWR